MIPGLQLLWTRRIIWHNLVSEHVLTLSWGMGSAALNIRMALATGITRQCVSRYNTCTYRDEPSVQCTCRLNSSPTFL